jgi:outer membrane scaffolding protein for murein synthesis (MipA/OmpV family)
MMLALMPAAALADKPLWELGLGAGVLHLPHYRGSDQTRDWLLPIPYFVYRGEVLRADREGARAVLVDTQWVTLDLSLAVNTPTRSQDNQAREGMADLAPTVEAGPSVNLMLSRGPGWQLDLRLPARAVFTVERQPRAIGWTVNPVLYLDLDLQGWDVAVQGGPVASSRAYNRYFYDVSAADARAGRPAFSSSGGAAGWVATANASRRWGPFWVGTYVQADGLHGATFEASPLLRQRLNLSYGLGLSWVFRESVARAADDH